MKRRGEAVSVTGRGGGRGGVTGREGGQRGRREGNREKGMVTGSEGVCQEGREGGREGRWEGGSLLRRCRSPLHVLVVGPRWLLAEGAG
jgi:hypothetical protein